jgi:hypothetical protein
MRGTPLLPPASARRILSDAQADGGAMRPTALHAALLYLFRLLYLEGYRSGIGSVHSHSAASVPEVAKRVERELKLAGIEVPPPATLESLDGLMEQHGFKPPLEMLERLAVHNRWIADTLFRLGEWRGAEPAGWVVFYVRQRVVEEGKVDLLLATLRDQGFILPYVPQPTPQKMQEIVAHVRGGNWGKGPYSLSGGEPSLVVVAFDPHPTPVPDALLRKHPLLDNARIQKAKKVVRKALHRGLARDADYNGLHSTDNSAQAWRAIRSMYPEFEADLRSSARPPNP